MALKPRTKDEGTWQALAPVDAAAYTATPAGTFGAAFDGAAFFGVSTCSKRQRWRLRRLSLVILTPTLPFSFAFALVGALTAALTRVGDY